MIQTYQKLKWYNVRIKPILSYPMSSWFRRYLKFLDNPRGIFFDLISNRSMENDDNIMLDVS